MIAIFCGIFAVLGLSLFLMCRFMKNKDKENRRSKRSGSFNRENADHYVDESNSEEALRKKIRVPRAKPRGG